MMINRENYEIYFIDYLEGNLEKSLVNDFIEFLQNNPDLKEELSRFKAISLKPNDISFDKKDTLYKEKLDLEKEFNKAAIASQEGYISETEKTELDNYLSKHPSKNRDILLFKKTKLKPDESIQFEKKDKLYRRTLGRTILFWSGRIAAILILAFALYLFIDKPATEIVNDNSFAVLEDKKVKKSDEPTKLERVPVESQKKESEKINKSTTKPVTKKVEPKQKPKRSLRESTKGRLTHEGLVMNRVPMEVPAELNSLSASLNVQQTSAELVDMYIRMPEGFEVYEDEYLLVDAVKEKTGLDKFSFNKITKAGLNLVKNISKEKFKYRTDNDGNIIKYQYDSKLFAFSIPSKSVKPE